MSAERDTVRVWRVEGPGLHEDADFVLYDSAEEAGAAAAEAALYAWDGSGEDARRPGPPITIRCYEMTRAEWESVLAEDEE